MEYVGCLNESLLKSLGIFLLRAYKDFFIMTKLSLGTLSLSQILFDDQGNIKIGPKLSWSYFSPKMSNFTSWRMLFSKILPIDTLTLNTHGNTPNNDIFEIGLILLYCAIGDIELFDCNAGSGDLKKNSDEMKETMFLKSDTNFFLNDRKKELKTEENMEFDKEIIGSSCCLLHLLWECCEEKKVGDYLKKRHSSKFFKSFSRKNGIFMKIILQKRFSKEFIDFLCCCLRFEQKNKVDIEIMMDHSFFNSNIEKGNNISLKEIVRISSNWKLNSSDFAIKETIGHIIQSLFIVLEEKNITKQKFLEGNHMEKLINVLALDLGMSQKMISDIVKAQIHKI